MSVKSLNLSSMLVSSKSTTAEYPGMPGFTVDLSFISRDEMVKIRKKATKSTLKKGQVQEELNDDLFLQLYVQSTVKGWKGLKIKYVAQLAPIDLGSFEDENEELEFSDENALTLVKSSTDFDSWVSDMVTDLLNFQKSSGKN